MTTTAPPAGCEDIGGKRYMRAANGSLTPIEVVRVTDRMQDDLVREIVAAAQPVADALRAFKTKSFDEVDAFVGVLASVYEATVGGQKGNMTLTTYDGLMRVQVQVADRISFGPELQVAKAGVDACLVRWAKDSGPELRALVDHAFKVDHEGQVNRGALFGLLRLDITDAEWVKAMQAIRDSIRVDGSRRYIRIYRREKADQAWRAVTLDLASA